MRSTLALLLGKLTFLLTRSLKRGGGSAAPGLYGLKVDPDLVEKLVSEIPSNVVITGTNGKTTTSKMIAHFATSQGLNIIRNHTGSNLERGIASSLIHHSSLLTLNSFDLGVWEIDEAAFNNVAPKLNPKVVVFLNVFRDQLDRYGEIDSIIKGWAKTLTQLPKETVILINGDDDNIKKLTKYFKGKIYQFGVKDYKIAGEGILHKKEQENLDYEAKDVKQNGLSGSSFQLTINKELLAINLSLPGIYHIYDSLAALSAGKILGLDLKKMVESLKTYSPAFGRVEKLDFGYIFLIKNPAGATQVFQTIAPQIKAQDKLLIALNDKIADGTDVSWIWDAEFEQLSVNSYQLIVICSGTRAYDLALRLKYAGFDPKNIIIEEDIENALKEAKKGLKGQLFILPTYTAMLELQGILAKSGVKKEYWKEN